MHAAASKRDQIGHRSCIAEALLDRKDEDMQRSSCVLHSALGKRLSYGSGASVLSLSRRSTEFANDASSTSCASSDGFQTSVSDSAGGRVSTHGTHDEGSKMLQMGVDEVLHWLRGQSIQYLPNAF